MKKILYLDLKFHIKTDSTRFLYELLEEYFLVNKFFINLDGKVDNVSRENADCYYDFLVLLQVMPQRKYIDTFSYGKGILFPMYDEVANKTLEEWNEYKDFTIINFSKTLHDYLTANGFGRVRECISDENKPYSTPSPKNRTYLFPCIRLKPL